VSECWIVTGPPCSGKTSWAREHTPDEVLDFDDLFASLTGLSLYVQPPDQRAWIEHEFRIRLEQVDSGSIVRTAPTRQHRAVLRRLHGARSVVLAVPAEVCLARLEASDRPAEVKPEHARAIARWWAQYQPSPSDALVLADWSPSQGEGGSESL
jgi:predicted kinase